MLASCQRTMKPSNIASGGTASAFLSFSMQDEALVASFKATFKRRVPSLVLLEHPTRELYDRDWKIHCRRKIDQSTILICLIGHSTYLSTAVAWEVSTGMSLGKPVIAVELVDEPLPRPDILKKYSIAPIRGTNDSAFYQAAQIIEFAYS